jgi:predicted phosphodiesterase
MTLGNNWDRWAIFSDNHGDCQDPKAIRAATKFLDLWKPTIRIHAGDNWDFRPLRRKASEEEKRELMRADFDAGMKFFKVFKPTHFLRGNHDERLWDLAKENKGIMSEYARSLIAEAKNTLDKFGSKMLPYEKRKGVLKLGKLRVIHGYCHGVTAARRSAQAYGSVFMGHAHSIQSSSIEGLDNRVGHIIGCLCLLDMDYSRATMASLVHRHGFRFGVIHRKSGIYQSWQAESINGTWIIPTDTMEIR